MRKTYKLVALGILAALALSIAPAHAVVGVTIDQAEGDVIFSLPPAPAPGDPVPTQSWPVDTALTGTATFANPDGAIGIKLLGPGGDSAGSAAVSCDEAGTTCTWSYTIPFFMTPGDYHVWVSATDADELEPVAWAPCDPAVEGCAGLAVVVL